MPSPLKRDDTVKLDQKDDTDDDNEGDKETDGRLRGRLVPVRTGGHLTPAEPLPIFETTNFAIGRGPRCLVRIDDVRVSKKHAIIVWMRGCAHVVDSSVNGTFVNGAKLVSGEERPLCHGDELSLVMPSKKKRPSDGVDYPSWLYQDLSRSEALPLPTSTDVTPSNSTATATATATTTASVSVTPPPASTASTPTPTGDLMEELTCAICSGILYKCVSALPCLHTFCSSCLSDWTKRSNQCPQCRIHVQQVRRNHKVMALVDAFLDKNPSLRWAPSDVAEMETRNTFTDEYFRAEEAKMREREEARARRRAAGEDDEDDEDDDGDDGQRGPRCRQCRPGGPFDIEGWTRMGLVEVKRGPPGYRCADHQPAAHLFCTECAEPFPDRTDAPQPTKCDLCARPFCDLYWGCHAPTGPGSIRPLREQRLEEIPARAIANNQVETEFLAAYLRAKGRAPNDAWNEILTKLDKNQWSFNEVATHATVTGRSLSCRDCFTRLVSPLLLKYRFAIPREEMPPEAVTRPNCFYGPACRTQSHNPGHAQKYNHICEQTRF
ncbi:putative E3 ubiquitin-protein ligase CHFR [Paratrimastix pyriformis]|uniref:E3 ubiquitin-protein ligase CHFR n=1 Tax=Paratrimastix pyriformis TaxID=342808 RepID=A0ABQ8UN56_9EUKA|nr:putative E3 ubiquitin-protein ligase CHFR [Paratrimastix pyriformis]